ncbi:acetylserotonin O-methyltransferase [Streptomyces tubbatahanensis]|uniref:Acetylserotonin O-methyltransferase n=1 Tax=Streptomyces tubbatahanensis TaxID=2923272 RepID=A0ABY3XLX6_9ACTN|nr:acetylserotonin O-methyltransferase [Streptomyces tubbatahanensis]UNS95395.1 acetylserotonin O-methyltransferase [Streptomyces tubbatahanensis]
MTFTPDDQPTGVPVPAPVGPLRDLMYGHIHASALRAVVEHGIADLLADGPRTAEELADRSGTRADPLRRVLRLLAARGLFHEENGAFTLTDSGTALRTDVPGSQHAPVLMFTDEMFRRAAAGIPGAVRTGEPGFDAAYGCSFFDHLAAVPDKSRLFDAAMTSRPGTVNAHITDGYPFPDSGTVVDVGGGRGGLLRDLLTRFRGLTGVLYDRPGTVAEHLLDEPELEGRWSTEGGDFFTAVPAGGDLYLLKNVLHDWSDEDCLRILGAVRAAMTPGARLLVIDAVLPDDGTPHPALDLDIVMLMVLRGRERTAADFRTLLDSSGFRLNRIAETPSLSSVIEAEAV